MKAVVLAAGEGRRLGPLTEGRPKAMFPLGNQPILESVLRAAIEAGIDEFVFVVGHARERIQSYFGDGVDWGVSIEYVTQEHQLGAANAISQVESIVEGSFLVLHGDQPVDAAVIERLCDRWSSTGSSAVAVGQSDRPTEYGAVEVDAEAVVSISTTPTADPPFLVNAGAYVLDALIFDEIRAMEAVDDGDFGMATALQRLADADTLTAVIHRGAWQDLTYPWDLLRANAALVTSRSTETDRSGVHDTAAVSDSTVIDDSASVGPNATLLPGTALGHNVRIGANATLSNCIVMTGAQIGDGAVLHDCIIGESVSIGPNVTVEGGPTRVVIDDTVHDDVDLGGVVADQATLRGNVTVTPGTVVGREVRADSGTVLSGRINSGETVRRG